MPMPIMLEDIVVHDDFPTHEEITEAHEEPFMHAEPHMHDGQHFHEGPHDLIDFSPEATQFAVEIVDPDSDLSVEVPHAEDDLPEGVDVVVTKDDEPILGIDLGDLPGAPEGTPDPEAEEESSDEKSDEESDIVVEEGGASAESADSNDARGKKGKKDKKDKWDWKSKGFGNFTIWVNERFGDVPKHSGYSEAGLERAQAYLERLHSEISKAMRSDIDGELDADIIAQIHDKIDEGIEKIKDRTQKVKNSKKKKASQSDDQMIKEAQKIFGVQNGVVVMTSLFISTLARALMNGMVSAGKDIEDSFKKIVKAHKLDDREQIELAQLLADMGMPQIRDRALKIGEEFNPESTENFDFSANYKA